MTDPFRASRLKVKRAEQHIAEFEAAFAAHLEKYPPEVGEQSASRPFGEFIKVVGFGGDTAGPIIGDTVHNLRAALDLMAVALVEARKGNSKNVYFPFCETAADLDEMSKRRNFHRAGPEALDIVKQLAPYAGGNAALRGLHDLDIQDKHHTLIPVTTAMRTPSARVHIDPETQKVTLEPLPFNPNDLLGCIFPDESAFAGREIVPTLKELVTLVGDIISAFAAILPDTSGK